MNFLLKNIKSKLKFFIYSILIFLFFIEFISFVATKFKFLLINKEPNYFYASGNKWRTETKPWGAWHKPNFKDRHQKECFDVEYQSNNLGARDDEPYDNSLPKDSIILIGDSVAEGLGVNLENTFSESLEKKIGRKVLNFGSAAFFGAVQEEILYRSLASQLPHNEIIYFFSPATDFTENDRRYWNTKFNKFRHRPYFKKIGEDKYEIFYPTETKNKSIVYLKSLLFHRFQVFIIRYTYTANTLRTINALYSKHTKKKDVISSYNEFGYSYFFNDHEAINGTLHFSKKLLKKAANLERRLVVVLPTFADLEAIENKKDYKNMKWYVDLKNISAETNSIFFDLADFLNRYDYENKMTLKCDGHWNAYGNNFVADIIRENFY
tara:strand:+ start:226 stop:1365 length:1140 start_codon:yes stop_codon:yes gene_type:complete